MSPPKKKAVEPAPAAPESEPVPPLIRQITDEIQARVGVAPTMWSRIVKDISPWVKEDGERVLTGVIAFIDWYNASTWRLAERPLTGAVFAEKFSDWYASWRANNILTLPKADADFDVRGTEFFDLSLPYSAEWFTDFFAYSVFSALQLDVFSTRFVAFQFRVKAKLPRFQTRHKAADFAQGFVAILLSGEFAWMARDQNLDTILRNFNEITAAFELANAVTYTEFR